LVNARHRTGWRFFFSAKGRDCHGPGQDAGWVLRGASHPAEGARDIIRDATPALIVEINPTRLIAAGTSPEELLDRIRGLNYSVFHADPARAGETRGRATWHRLPEVWATDIKPDRDFDVVAFPR